MNEIILVGIGGFLGSVSRYLSVLFVNSISGVRDFPLGTMAVNVLGCFLLGLGLGLAAEKQMLTPAARFFLFTGFLGSFTTYSTFGAESFNLYKTGSLSWGALNIILHVIIGLSAVWAGDYLSRAI